jgi:hypothetical protein
MVACEVSPFTAVIRICWARRTRPTGVTVGVEMADVISAARIVPYVEAMTADWLPKELTPRLTTFHQDISAVSDFDTHLNDKLQFLPDATLGFINIAQNNVMKVMAIASVVGIPPVLIAGVYGMNFKNIPEYDWAWGYTWAWVLIIITTLVSGCGQRAAGQHGRLGTFVTGPSLTTRIGIACYHRPRHATDTLQPLAMKHDQLRVGCCTLIESGRVREED